jgi:hypothetical protein
MSNRVFHVPASVGPRQVDGFPEGCERSRKGAIHLRPASTLVVTEGELAHLKAQCPQEVAKFVDITPEAPPIPAAQPASVEPVTVIPEAGLVEPLVEDRKFVRHVKRPKDASPE